MKQLILGLAVITVFSAVAAGSVPSIRNAVIETRDATLDGKRLLLGNKIDWPGISVLPAKGSVWDLKEYRAISLKVKNLSPLPRIFRWRIDNPGADGVKNCITENFPLQPGEEETLHISLTRGNIDISDGAPAGMRGIPGQKLDLSRVSGIILFVSAADAPAVFEVGDFTLLRGEPRRSMTLAEYLPFVDRFGQYKHAAWPGKVTSEEELKKDIAKENAALAKHPASSERWDAYGGWADGLKLAATGRFRTEKIGGKWWLVTPDGHLFWSNGAASVETAEAVVTDRENYFEFLPRKGKFAQFWNKGTWKNPPGFYSTYSSYDCYNYGNANLYRKYGENWRERFYDSTERRFRSWGLNTLGAWADRGLTSRGRIPYTVYLNIRPEPIRGSSGMWGPFPDPFSASFREGLRWVLSGYKEDKMRIGFFVNNELHWGEETYLALATLRSPAEQPAKKAFLDYLKEKFGSIDKLNAAWKTSFASWEALLASQAVPAEETAQKELAEFSGMIADRYFLTAKEEIDKALPGSLFLGCRFAAGFRTGRNIIASAAKYCDVVSFNSYNRTPGSFEIDKPILIGEFHFGALDRGLLHEGLFPVVDQQARGKAYAAYLRAALETPQIVGAHWFQYADEPVSGRSDGENYQIGLIDVCDRPYPETIRALRDVSYRMYSIRAGSHSSGN